MMLLSHAVTWVARQAANWYMYMEGLPLQHEVLLITESAAAVPSGYEVRIAAYSNIHSVNFNIWIPQFETDVSAVVSSTQSGGPDPHFHQVAECQCSVPCHSCLLPPSPTIYMNIKICPHNLTSYTAPPPPPPHSRRQARVGKLFLTILRSK